MIAAGPSAPSSGGRSSSSSPAEDDLNIISVALAGALASSLCSCPRCWHRAAALLRCCAEPLRRSHPVRRCLPAPALSLGRSAKLTHKLAPLPPCCADEKLLVESFPDRQKEVLAVFEALYKTEKVRRARCTSAHLKQGPLDRGCCRPILALRVHAATQPRRLSTWRGALAQPRAAGRRRPCSSGARLLMYSCLRPRPPPPLLPQVAKEAAQASLQLEQAMERAAQSGLFDEVAAPGRSSTPAGLSSWELDDWAEQDWGAADYGQGQQGQQEGQRQPGDEAAGAEEAGELALQAQLVHRRAGQGSSQQGPQAAATPEAEAVQGRQLVDEQGTLQQEAQADLQQAAARRDSSS